MSNPTHVLGRDEKMDDETLEVVGAILKKFRKEFPGREIMGSIYIEVDGKFFQEIRFD